MRFFPRSERIFLFVFYWLKYDQIFITIKFVHDRILLLCKKTLKSFIWTQLFFYWNETNSRLEQKLSRIKKIQKPNLMCSYVLSPKKIGILRKPRLDTEGLKNEIRHVINQKWSWSSKISMIVWSIDREF
jgi:hypothetical protein